VGIVADVHRFKKTGDFMSLLLSYIYYNGDTQQCSWLKHYAAIRKVMGSIPYGAIGFFK
jgi:hypothetical protein